MNEGAKILKHKRTKNQNQFLIILISILLAKLLNLHLDIFRS